jgi:hypothetical protein
VGGRKFREEDPLLGRCFRVGIMEVESFGVFSVGGVNSGSAKYLAGTLLGGLADGSPCRTSSG